MTVNQMPVDSWNRDAIWFVLVRYKEMVQKMLECEKVSVGITEQFWDENSDMTTGTVSNELILKQM